MGFRNQLVSMLHLYKRTNWLLNLNSHLVLARGYKSVVIVNIIFFKPLFNNIVILCEHKLKFDYVYFYYLIAGSISSVLL